MSARLEIDTLGVRLGSEDVLHGVTAALPAGQFVALTGPNGAGKSTLLRALAGLQRHSGAALLDGAPIAGLPANARARAIGYLPQGHQTHWPLPVREIVALGRFAHGATDPRRLSRADAAAVDAAMTATGVAAFADRPATRLSGGEKARVALARVLALEPQVILADEPTASLDPRYQIEIMELLAATAKNGALVIAITHDLGHAASFAERVLVLDRGRLAADGAPAAALSPAVLAGVFGLKAPPR